jgi:hypothetical protein
MEVKIIPVQKKQPPRNSKKPIVKKISTKPITLLTIVIGKNKQKGLKKIEKLPVS